MTQVAALGGQFNVSGLPAWSAAVRNVIAGVADAPVLLVGESTHRFGANGGGPLWTQSAVPSYLVDRINNAGRVGASCLGVFGGSGNLITGIDNRVTSLGSWTATGAEGLGGQAFLATSGTSPFVFTPQGPFGPFDVYYPIFSGGGSFSVAIDDVVIDTISNAGTAALGKKTYSVDEGAHTIKLARVSGTALFTGVSPRNAVKKIMALNTAEGGRLAADWTIATAPYAPLPSITAIAAPLVVVDDTINSMLAGVAAATIAASLGTVIDTVKAYGGDVVLMSANPVPTGSVSQVDQQACRDALAALAVTKSVKFIDLFTIWGGTVAGVPGGMSSGVHPSDTAYGVKADLEYAAIMT